MSRLLTPKLLLRGFEIFVVGSLAGGMSKEEIIQEYELTLADIDAALAYAADLVATTEVVLLAG